MADTPETGVDVTDEDLDEIVGSLGLDTETEAVTEDPAPAAPAPVTGEADEPDEPGTPAAGEEERDDQSPTQPAPPAASPAAIPGAKPFQFKASGAMHALPGALELPDGTVLVPKDALPEFRQRLASERELSANRKQIQRDYDRRLKAAETKRTAKDVEADAVIGLLADVKRMTPDERWDFFNTFDQEAPKLELAIERQKLELERQALLADRAGPQLSEEEQQEQFTTALTGELNRTFQRIQQDPAVKVLTPEEIRRVYDKHAKRVDRLASRDEKGQIIFDDADVIEDLQLLIETKQKYGSTTTAAARNAALNADTATNPIPPTVRGVPPVSGQPRRKDGTFKAGQGKDWKRAFKSGALDDD